MIKKLIYIYIHELDLTLTAYILDDSPPILSVGCLYRMHGFIFVQNGAQNPVLYDNKFTQGTTLRVRNDVPFMLPELTNEPLIKTPVTSPRRNYDAATAKKEMEDIIQSKQTDEERIEDEKAATPSKADDDDGVASVPQKAPAVAKAKPKAKDLPKLDLSNLSTKAEKGSDDDPEPAELVSGFQKTSDKTDRAPNEFAAEPVLPTVASGKIQ